MGFRWKPAEGDGLFVSEETKVIPRYGALEGRNLYKWFNHDSFFCAWELVKQAQGGQFTAWGLAHALGCSQRTIYRWLNEETALPQAHFLRRMAQLFCNLIREDWMEKVEELQIAQEPKTNYTRRVYK